MWLTLTLLLLSLLLLLPAPCCPPGRETTGPTQIGPYKVPEGIVVWPMIYALQNSTHNWEEPEKFKPVRNVVANHGQSLSNKCTLVAEQQCPKTGFAKQRRHGPDQEGVFTQFRQVSKGNLGLCACCDVSGCCFEENISISVHACSGSSTQLGGATEDEPVSNVRHAPLELPGQH
jgi:hypothetical protein